MNITISKKTLLTFITDSYNIEEEKSSTFNNITHTMMQLIKKSDYDIDIIVTIMSNDSNFFTFFNEYLYYWDNKDYSNEPKYRDIIEQLQPEDALIFNKALPKYFSSLNS